MTYSELVNCVEAENYRMTKWDVVCMLIGMQKVVTEQDWHNIKKLYDDGFIDHR